MKYDLVIFDLDGTILNTLGDLANAVNHALDLHGLPRHSIEEIRSYIGNGVANLISKSVPVGTDEAECRSILADFKAYYSSHVNVETVPYGGICELMRSLREAGIKIGINSNKFDAALQSLCRSHFSGLYDDAVGESSVTPRKPDPSAALRIMERFSVSKSRTIYIGDSGVDYDTAKNAGIDFAWVAWGFRSAEDMKSFKIDNRFSDVESLKSFLLS